MTARVPLNDERPASRTLPSCGSDIAARDRERECWRRERAGHVDGTVEMTGEAACIDAGEACGLRKIDGGAGVRRNGWALSDDVGPTANHHATLIRLGGQLFDPHAAAIEPESPRDRARQFDLTGASREPSRPEPTRSARRPRGVHR